MKRLVIIISGRGSNMAAILDAVAEASIPALVAGVISNRPEAPGLAIAASRGVATTVVDHRRFPDRRRFEHALTKAIDALQPDLVVLAGFMRVLSPEFVEHYAGHDYVTPRIDARAKIVEVPRPAGVVLALTPSTNPVATVFFKRYTWFFRSIMSLSSSL